MIGATKATRRPAQLAPAPKNDMNRLNGSTRIAQQRNRASGSFLPWFLLVVAVGYVLWGVIERHERIRTRLQPKAIGISIRNLLVILGAVLVGVPLFKIAVGKYAIATKGAFGSRVLTQWAGLV